LNGGIGVRIRDGGPTPNPSLKGGEKTPLP
jgi:hypothetical protein